MDSVHKLSRTVLAHRDQCPPEHLAARPKLIAVAGQGRTTTSYLIPSVLAAGGYPTGVYGCLGLFDGCRWDLRAPWPNVGSRLAEWMAGLAASGCSHGVIEQCATGLSTSDDAEFFLDIACIADFAPAGSVVGSRGNSRAEATQLLGRLAPEGFAIVNADDPAVDKLLAEIDGPVLTVGVKRPAEITATLIERCSSEQTFLLSAENETIAVRTRLCGDDSLTSCLMAAAVGAVYGIELPAIVQGLEAIEQLPDHASQREQGRLHRAA